MQGASDYAQAQADLIKRQQQYLLDEAKKSEENRLKALETANQQAINKLNQDKIKVNEDTDILNRQEYLSKMMNQESLNQNLSRYKIGTSGARETSLNNLYAQYGENVNQNNIDRKQGLRDIDSQISDTDLAYQTNRSNVLSEEAANRTQLQQYIDAQAKDTYNQAYNWYVEEEQRKEEQRRYEESLRQIHLEAELKRQQLAQEREYQQQQLAFEKLKWQKEYELAKKQAESLYADLTDSVQSNQTKTQNTSNFSNASALQSKLSKSKPTKNGSTNLAYTMQYNSWKENAKLSLQDALKSGQITESDVKTIYKNLGL